MGINGVGVLVSVDVAVGVEVGDCVCDGCTVLVGLGEKVGNAVIVGCGVFVEYEVVVTKVFFTGTIVLLLLSEANNLCAANPPDWILKYPIMNPNKAHNAMRMIMKPFF